MFLTRDELERLTGRKYAPAQKRVLRERKIPYDEDDFGRPIVLAASIERKLLGQATSEEPAIAPDFSAFPRLA